VEFFQKQEIISEYEMKLKMLETEMGHFKKCLTSNQELLQFSVSKNMQLADEVQAITGNYQSQIHHYDLYSES
jgi:hypothetical protein